MARTIMTLSLPPAYAERLREEDNQSAKVAELLEDEYGEL